MTTTALKGRPPMIFAPLASNLDATGLAAATFTRASAGTYIDPADSLLKIAATNAPRFEKNGLLMEPQRSNLCLCSEDLSSTSYWSTVNAGVTANQSAGPTGASEMDLIAASGSVSGWHIARQTGISGTAGTVYTVSVFAKAGTSNYLVFGDAGEAHYHMAVFNLSTGAVVLLHEAAYVLSAAIEHVSGGIYRCSVTFSKIATGNIWIWAGPGAASNGALTYTDSGETVYAWGVQCEAGYGPTSYIATTSSAVTRAVDGLTWPMSESLKAVLSIDKAWSLSYQDETGAAFGGTNNLYDFTDAAALAKFTGLDISPYASSGKMIILRDGAGKIAWGYLGSVSQTTGCEVYKDPALASRGWTIEAAAFNTGDTAYTFDIVNACKAEATWQLVWTPGCANTEYTGEQNMIGFMNNRLTLDVVGGSGGAVRTYNMSGSGGTSLTPYGWARNAPIVVTGRFSTLTGKAQISARKNGVLTHGPLATGVTTRLGEGPTVMIYSAFTPNHFKNLAIYRRWLPDGEL